MIWYRGVIQKLNATGVFKECIIIGAKIRALISETLFLDIYLLRSNDKKLFIWLD